MECLHVLFDVHVVDILVVEILHVMCFLLFGTDFCLCFYSPTEQGNNLYRREDL